MQLQLINHANVIKATQYLLNLNHHDIDERFQQDAHFWIFNLNKAYCAYQACFNGGYLNTSFFGLEKYDIEGCTKRLCLHANSFAYILNNQSQQDLAQYLLQNEISTA